MKEGKKGKMPQFQAVENERLGEDGLWSAKMVEMGASQKQYIHIDEGKSGEIRCHCVAKRPGFLVTSAASLLLTAAKMGVLQEVADDYNRRAPYKCWIYTDEDIKETAETYRKREASYKAAIEVLMKEKEVKA